MDALAAVPSPSSKRLAARVTNDAIRHIRAGHPWVFDRSITSVSNGGRAGDLAVVFGADRQFIAIGLYDPDSPIRLRILHHGRPLTIDAAFWAHRVAVAIERRAAINQTGETTGLRIIHGENDGFSGLVLDRYDTTFVLKLYTPAWLPHLRLIVDALLAQLEVATLIVRFSRDVAGRELFGLGDGDTIAGAPPDRPVLFREHGLIFAADVVHGQKTGHFLDQRDNRLRVRRYAKEASVLDVFACTGGFSVFAAAGGATSVRSVDLSAGALSTATRNMAHNAFIASVRQCRYTTQVGDAFAVMHDLAQSGKRFGMVIVDPPSFARRQSDRDRALHAYRRLTGLALRLIDDGGILVQSSCSSRITADEFYATIHSAAAAGGTRIEEMLRTGHGADHPISFPEGAYLKTLFARVHR